MPWCHRSRTHNIRVRGNSNQHEGGGEERDMDGGKEGWRPSVYSATLILFAATLVLACGASTPYSAMESWSYIESLYFCFVAFSTVGFRDLVSSQEESYGGAPSGTYLPHHAPGVYCTYSLFNALSVIIKRDALDPESADPSA